MIMKYGNKGMDDKKLFRYKKRLILNQVFSHLPFDWKVTLM